MPATLNARQTIENLVNMPIEQAIMLVSPHGMGKSSVVKQSAKLTNSKFVDIRLSQCEVGDIKGLPYLNKETRTTEFFKPRWWPRDMKSKGILFLDELNRANNEVLQAVFELVLDRRLDGDMLPPGWRIAVAINGDERYQVAEFDSALWDRFFVVDFRPDVKEWLEWAEGNGIHPAIIQFIGADPSFLDPPKELTPGKVYPSRRSWDKFNRAMNARNVWESKDPALLTEISLGWVGTSAGIRFGEFFLKDFKLVSGEQIIENFEEVKDDLIKMCGDPAAIITIARGIPQYLKRSYDEGKEITEENFENLKKVIKLLPKEVASSVWIETVGIRPVRTYMAKLRNTDPEFLKYAASLYVRNKKA